MSEKLDNWEKYSVYFLNNDKKTDFAFYVFIDEGDETNPLFLKKLFKYLENPAEEELLNSTKEDEPGLKLIIERYPYRLFVVCDFNERGIDNLKNDKSQFIRKRICWIDKKEFEKAKNNPDNLISESIQPNLSAFKEEEKFKLWLYLKWLSHWMKIKNLDKKELYVSIRTKGEAVHLPVTLPPGFEKIENVEENASILNINFNDMTIKFDKLNAKNKIQDKQNRLWIAYERHINLAIGTFASEYDKFYYSEDTSGAQFQFPLFSQLQKENFLKYYTALSLVENGLFKIGIVDERFTEWFESLSAEDKFRLMWSGIMPVEVINGFDNVKEIKYSDYNDFKLNLDSIDMNVKPLLEEIKRQNTLSSFVSKFYNINKKTGEYENVKEDEVENLKEIFSKLDILIIHQGVLDKVKGDIKNLISELKETIPFIIITSGRGKPENLPKGEKFLPFSNLSYIMKLPPDDIIFRKIILKLTEVAE